METDKSLWTEKYVDEKYGEERTISFKYFKKFIEMPKPRTLVSFQKQLSKEMSKAGRKRIPTLATINEYSCKWHWIERSKAYDEYIEKQDEEEMIQKVKEIRRKRILKQERRMDFQDLLFEQLIEDKEMGTNQKVYGASKNSEAIRNETASFNEIINEGDTNLNLDGSLNQKMDINSNPFKDKKDYKKELESLRDELEE